ncbi:MAG: lipase maturation factor family protein [Maioricimonas sp. JB049]
MSSNWPAPHTYVLSRWLFLRAVGAVTLVAVLSLWWQIDGLVGSGGILPVGSMMTAAREQLGPWGFLKLPTLCWLSSADWMLHAHCAVAVLLSLALLVNIAPRCALGGLWLVYLSLSVAGQAFLGFQWDTLLLETLFCSLFWAPPGWRPRLAALHTPSRMGRWLLWLLLIKLMFLSGITKLLSGDPTWRALTALDVHYQTQPIPNWVSWYAHHLPGWWQQFSIVCMYVIELALPFLVFGPRFLRLLAAAGLILLQIAIELTGNYGYFNLLTIVLCIPLLDDHVLMWCIPGVDRAVGPAGGGKNGRLVTLGRRVSIAVVMGVSVLTLLEEMVTAQRRDRLPDAVVATLDGIDRVLVGPAEPVLTRLQPFRTINGYGLFRVMTTERFEIIIEVSDDGRRWRELEFPCKPGDVERAPPVIAPYHPRLDWQMWFAALNPARNEYWLMSLMQQILKGSPAVAGLLGQPDVAEKPPRSIRMVYYRYEFSRPEERQRSGVWWTRSFVQQIAGPFSLPER